ncbi:sigma-70 family RNA polymerase sigma factor [bacterium]|nr:sigma-70 family RNA polymerase sigma factor [bacterium]
MDLKEIIKQNQHNVKSIIRLITKEEENEDLEQEVYVKVWKNADKYKEQGSFSSWIKTIAKNVSRDYLKSSYRKKQDITSSEDETIVLIRDKKSTPENKALRTERQEIILKAINELKPKFKEVIILCEIEGFSYEECANKLKCPLGTVKSRLYNAKKELAEKLKDLM